MQSRSAKDLVLNDVTFWCLRRQSTSLRPQSSVCQLLGVWLWEWGKQLNKQTNKPTWFLLCWHHLPVMVLKGKKWMDTPLLHLWAVFQKYKSQPISEGYMDTTIRTPISRWWSLYLVQNSSFYLKWNFPGKNTAAVTLLWLWVWVDRSWQWRSRDEYTPVMSLTELVIPALIIVGTVAISGHMKR